MNNKKQVKCRVCEKRYTRQQDWKTEEEKLECFTCRCLKEGLMIAMRFYEQKADEKGLRLYWKVQFEPKVGKKKIIKKI